MMDLVSLVCGTSLMRYQCRFHHDDFDRLIYDGDRFRCLSKSDCDRVDSCGKFRVYMHLKIDRLKVSLINKQIQLLKENPEQISLKLVRKGTGKKIFIDLGGKLITPSRFSRGWSSSRPWTFQWEKDFESLK